MTVETFGCIACGERRRDIKRLISKARHQAWLGHSVEGPREQVRALKRQIADCASAGHLVTAPLRERHQPA